MIRATNLLNMFFNKVFLIREKTILKQLSKPHFFTDFENHAVFFPAS